ISSMSAIPRPQHGARYASWAASHRTGPATSTRSLPRSCCNMCSAVRARAAAVAAAVALGGGACGTTNAAPARVTVPPGATMQAAVSDTALLRRLDIPTTTVEGYLFPDTYFFPPGTAARSAVLAMARRFEQRWRPEWSARLDTLAVSRHDLVTLASIVEREAKRPEERPVIAAVYWNRLRRGMLLQADPTVQYALPEHKTRLLSKHLTVKSKY